MIRLIIVVRDVSLGSLYYLEKAYNTKPLTKDTRLGNVMMQTCSVVHSADQGKHIITKAI